MKYSLIVKKEMKKLFKNIFCLFLVLSLTSGCKSVKDGFGASKKSNSDEFLVEKKNPLVLPPEYDKLPEPGIEEGINNKKENDLKSLLTNESSSTKEISKTPSGSLEKSILEKIKNN